MAVSYVPEKGEEDSENLIIKGNYEFCGLNMGAAYASIGQGDVMLQKHKAMAFTFGYDFDRFSIGGRFQSIQDIAGVSGVDRDSYSVGVRVNIGQRG
jgi:predicted porin